MWPALISLLRIHSQNLELSLVVVVCGGKLHMYPRVGLPPLPILLEGSETWVRAHWHINIIIRSSKAWSRSVWDIPRYDLTGADIQVLLTIIFSEVLLENTLSTLVTMRLVWHSRKEQKATKLYLLTSCCQFQKLISLWEIQEPLTKGMIFGIAFLPFMQVLNWHCSKQKQNLLSITSKRKKFMKQNSEEYYQDRAS